MSQFGEWRSEIGVRAGAALSALGVSTLALGSVPAKPLVDQLSGIRAQVMGLEQGLLRTSREQQKARANVQKIHLLLALQKQERELGQKRLAELEQTVQELQERREILRAKIRAQQVSIRKSLIAIEGSMEGTARVRSGSVFNSPEQERIDAPRRKTLANLVDRGLKEIEALRIDLSDSDQLESHIQEEKQQLAYLFQDLKEQESVLELNQQLQSDLLLKQRKERFAQLENYRRLKAAESQVEHLIDDFNARRELERSTETERVASQGLASAAGEFPLLKGKLPLPVQDGRVISSFGRAYDPKSQLYVFKKGIDIVGERNHPVHAVSAGKVAFSGELRDYGRVTIIDHGDHYYSLCAHLGEFSKKAGDPVSAGEVIGLTDDLGTPVYFEIRARNVAVNPLQWLSN